MRGARTVPGACAKSFSLVCARAIRRSSDTPKIAAPREASSMAAPTPPNLHGVHVLLVDDTEDALEILRSYLMHVGATLTTARSGSEALGMLQQIQAHVIVSDLSMPGFTGFEFIERLREVPGQRARPTPAIAFTAFADAANRARALDSGFQVFVSKPTDPLGIAV